MVMIPGTVFSYGYPHVVIGFYAAFRFYVQMGWRVRALYGCMRRAYRDTKGRQVEGSCSGRALAACGILYLEVIHSRVFHCKCGFSIVFCVFLVHLVVEVKRVVIRRYTVIYSHADVLVIVLMYYAAYRLFGYFELRIVAGNSLPGVVAHLILGVHGIHACRQAFCRSQNPVFVTFLLAGNCGAVVLPPHLIGRHAA